jgi:DUF971 family protein
VDAVPTEIRRVADREIHVTWADGHRGVLLNTTLRERCPCAGCVDEQTGRRILDPKRVPRDVRADGIELVGRYAIRVQWSDRHSTGIYPFPRLREWCECEVCRGAAPAAP